MNAKHMQKGVIAVALFAMSFAPAAVFAQYDGVSNDSGCCNSDVYTGWDNSASDVLTGWDNSTPSSDVYTGWDNTTPSSDVYTGWDNSPAMSDVYTGWNNSSPNSDVYTGWDNSSPYSDVYTGWNNSSPYSDVYSGWDHTSSILTTSYDTTGYGYSSGYSLASGLGYSVGSMGYGYAPYSSYYASQPIAYSNPVSYPVSQPRVTTTSNTSNYCTGNSCNSSYVNNSINGSYNNYSSNSYTPPVVYGSAPIYVAQPQPIVQYQMPYYQNYQSAYCTITASPTSIQNGQAAYLTWSSNGTSAILSDGIGSVAANGSLAVRPNTTRTYVLTVYGPYGSNSCSTTISVAGYAPSVSLSQIPYTGFDYGTVGNTIYWFALAAFAIALSYLALYYKGGMTILAGLFANRRTAAYAAPTPAPVAHTAHVEMPTVKAHAPATAHRGMKDTMTITRDHDGTPRIVIHRA